LEAIGRAGAPGFLFHNPSLDAWLAYFDLAPMPDAPQEAVIKAIFAASLQKGRGGTEIFGLRLQHGSFAFFMEKLARLHPDQSDDGARFEVAIGPTLFVHLTRRDKLSQALSLVRARQTGLWHRAPDGREIERLARPAGLHRDEAL